MTKNESTRKTKETLNERDKLNIRSRQKEKLPNATQDWYMQTTSKINSLNILTVLTATLLSAIALADELILKAPTGSVRVVSEDGVVFARDETGRKNYVMSKSFSRHLKQSSEATLINIYGGVRNPIFLIFTREPSRPNSLGQGYCGAGYEDYLLLAKIEKKTISVKDEYLLQSCLKTKSLRMETSDEHPKNFLHLNPDGSYDYEMIADKDQQLWNIKISKEKFIRKSLSKK